MRSIPTCFPSLAALLLAAALAGPAFAAFTSGSDGSDGALTIPAGDGSPQTIDFDPRTINGGIDANGDSVYHFTTITIPANITLRLRADKCGSLPIHWLATGDVVIAGTLDLSATGVDPVPFGQLPQYSVPGPGGFPGGLGRTPTSDIQGGFGPGAGKFNAFGGNYAGVAYGNIATYGNGYLLPLVGGSGGAGGDQYEGKSCSGGAGGGAILIASNTSVTVGGSILSLGGAATGVAGDGSGGAVRILAPVFGGNGVIDVNPFRSSSYYGGPGRIRVEATTNTYTGTFDGDLRSVPLFDASPTGVNDPRTKITVLTVGGQSVPAQPAGVFTAPDVTINTGAPVAITARVDNPPAAPVEYSLNLFNDTEFTTTTLPVSVVPGAGSATLTYSVRVASGFTRGFVSMAPPPATP